MLFEHSPIKTWKMDENGFLRVRARLLSAGVMAYRGDELGNTPQAPDINEHVSINVPPDEIFSEEVMRSVEGMPVVADQHKWIEADDASRGAYEIGSIAGSPRREGAYLEADLLIRDKKAIEKIKAGELEDVSSGYLAKFDMTPGRYSSVPFDGEQKGIKFNHVALLPPGEGRGGRDVRILNSGTKVKEMELKSIKVNNRSFSVASNDAEPLSDEIKIMVENQTANANELEAVMAELKEAKEGLDMYKAKHEEASGKMAEMKAQIDELMNPTNMQEAANKMAEEQKEGAEMLVNSGAEEDKEKAMNSLKNLNGHGLKVKVVNSIRGAQKKDALTEEQSKSEAYVSGIFSAMGDYVKQVTNSSFVPGSKVIKAQMENTKVQNSRGQDDDPLSFGGYDKFVNGES